MPQSPADSHTPPAAVPAKPPANVAETIRVHQANERTMLAWIRTGIALMAIGFAIARFGLFMRELAGGARVANEHLQSIGSAWLGVALVALGMLMNAAATVNFRRVRKGIEEGRVGAPSAALVYLLGALIALVGALMVALLVRAIAT